MSDFRRVAESRRNWEFGGFVVGVITLLVGTYIAVAAPKGLWPFSGQSNGSYGGARGIPASYQHTWNGQIALPEDAIALSLKLGAGGINAAIGSISSSTLGCAALVYLRNDSGPITLSLVASTSSGACGLVSLIGSASITLNNSYSLKFTVDLDGEQESCYLHR
jgi:hypothetical protein